MELLSRTLSTAFHESHDRKGNLSDGFWMCIYAEAGNGFVECVCIDRGGSCAMKERQQVTTIFTGTITSGVNMDLPRFLLRVCL